MKGNKQKIHKNYIRQVTDDTSSDGEWLNSVKTPDSKDVRCRTLVGGEEVIFQIDTGSSVNLIPVRHAARILRPTNKILKMWSHTHLSPLGYVETISATPGMEINTVSNL